MRKTLASALFGLSALTLPIAAHAQSAPTAPTTPWYGQLNAGLLFLQDSNGRFGGFPGEAEYKTGYSLSGSLGYRFLGGWRAEGEFGYGRVGYDKIRGAGVSDGERSIYSFTGNAFYDFQTGTFITPYIGGGVGLVRSTFDNGNVNFGAGNVDVRRSDKTSFTALAEAGAAVAITPSMDLVPSYRFQWINDGSDGYDNTRAHMLRLGLRVNF